MCNTPINLVPTPIARATAEPQVRCLLAIEYCSLYRLQPRATRVPAGAAHARLHRQLACASDATLLSARSSAPAPNASAAALAKRTLARTRVAGRRLLALAVLGASADGEGAAARVCVRVPPFDRERALALAAGRGVASGRARLAQRGAGARERAGRALRALGRADAGGPADGAARAVVLGRQPRAGPHALHPPVPPCICRASARGIRCAVSSAAWPLCLVPCRRATIRGWSRCSSQPDTSASPRPSSRNKYYSTHTQVSSQHTRLSRRP